MTWTKLGEEFGDECWTLSDKAFRLHVEGLLWSNRKATDGQLAKDDVRRWGRHPEMAAELVDRGWWKDRGGHYEIIHHIGYQRTAEQIVNQSIANKENAKRRWSRGKPNQAASVSDSECDSHNDSECNKNRTDQNRAFKREGPKKSRTEHRSVMTVAVRAVYVSVTRSRATTAGWPPADRGPTGEAGPFE